MLLHVSRRYWFRPSLLVDLWTDLQLSRADLKGPARAVGSYKVAAIR